MTPEVKAELARLSALICRCVQCDDCNGTGQIRYSSNQFDDETESCDSCSGGIVEVCDRCREMEELETP